MVETAAGVRLDAWQREVLRSEARRALLLVTRQGGKSTVAAGRGLHRALYTAGSLVLLLAPALRQSQELFAKVRGLYHGLQVAASEKSDTPEPVAVERLSALQVEFVNGSRIIALPGTEKTVRGFSGVDLLIIDEAARVLDELYYSVRPMLAVSGGELLALSTPWGKRGWFYDEWTSAERTGGEDWHRVRIAARDCPRITAEFLDEERRTMPAAWFASEYEVEFGDTVNAVFPAELVERLFSPDVEPLFPTGGDGTNVPAPAIAGGVAPLFS